MKKREQDFELVFHCYNLPGREFDGQTEIRLGIQRGDSVREDVPADREEVVFTFPLRALFNPETAQVDFRGPFVQGKRDERFVYFVWGVRDGDHWITIRRAKFYLRFLDPERLNRARDSGQPISLRLEMTDAKGKPLTASIRESSFQFLP